MEMRKMLRKHESGFSLIEMLVVLLILAALVTQLLPTVNKSEAEINRVADQYNAAGTLRYMETFNSLHASYPSDLHTGMQSSNVTSAVMDGISVDVLMAMRKGIAPANATQWTWDGVSQKVFEGIGNLDGVATAQAQELTVCEAASLKNAGIKSLVYGATSAAIELDTAGGVYTDANTSVSAGAAGNPQITFTALGTNAAASFAKYYENSAGVAGDLYQNVTLFNQTVNNWAGLITPKATDTLAIFFVSADVNWDTYYATWTGNTETGATIDDKYEDTGDSLISLKLPARSPYMSNGSWNYYMCVFALDNSIGAAGAPLIKQAAPAQLIAVFSPGHLETLTP